MVFLRYCEHFFVHFRIPEQDQHSRALTDEFHHGMLLVAGDHDPSPCIAVDQLFLIVARQNADRAVKVPLGIIIDNFAIYGGGKVFRRCITENAAAVLGISQGKPGNIALGDPSDQSALFIRDAEGFSSVLFHFPHSLEDRSIFGDGNRLIQIDLIHIDSCGLQKMRFFKMKPLQQVFAFHIDPAQTAGYRIHSLRPLEKGITDR